MPTPAQPSAARPEISSRAWAELALLGLVWGASFVSVAVALREMGFFTTVLHRVFWAAVILWIWVVWRGLPVPRSARVWGALLAMGILNNVLPFSLMAWGQTQIESGLTAILNAATALFAVLLAAAVFADQRLTLRRLAGVMLGFVGVVVAIGAEALGGFDLRSLAQIAVLGGTLSYACAGIWARLALGGLSPAVSAAGMTSASALIMLPVAIWQDGLPGFALSIEGLAAIAYIAGPGTALAYLLYYRILGMAGPGNLMLVTLLIPVVAILLGAAVLGEALRPSALIGFVLLAAGLAMLDGRVLTWLSASKAR
ncbi:MAG: DMT family transporter [Pseudomonadota bacterium]